MKKRMNFAEVCELTGLGRQTIYTLRKESLFPQPRMLGKRKLIWDTAVIELWLDGKWKSDKKSV